MGIFMPYNGAQICTIFLTLINQVPPSISTVWPRIVKCTKPRVIAARR